MSLANTPGPSHSRGEKRLSEPIGGNNAGAEVWKLCKN